MLRVLLCGVGLLIAVGVARAQEGTALPRPAEEFVVRFDSARTILDDGDFHIDELRRTPTEELRLPDVDTTGARFLALYYSRAVEGHEDDPTLSVLVLPHPDGRLLFPDINNDEDLGNDGPPHLLAGRTGTVTFPIVAPDDPRQVTHRGVGHLPTSVRTGRLSKAWFDNMFDEEGNLGGPIAMLNGISGRQGTFIFKDRPVLARGLLRLPADTLAVGVYDMNVNGRYDDPDDLLLVDLDRDGLLTFSGDSAYVFKLDEVFAISEQRYRLSEVDPYGRGVRFVEVEDLPTATYLAEKRAAYDAADIEPRASHVLDAAFWDLALPTIDGDTLHMADLRGRPFLLNVWGEWCAPCRMEMPALVAADSLLGPDGLQIVGVLATSDEAAARSYLASIGADWPQVRFTDALRERFNVWRYPTNLFVGAEGETAIEAGMVNLRFLEQQVNGH